MLLILCKIVALSILSASVFAVCQVGLGYLFIHQFGFHDPRPRYAEFGSILDSLWTEIPAYIGLYLLGLLMAWRDFISLGVGLAVGQTVVVGLLFACFITWYHIPRDESYWVVWLMPVALNVVVYFSTWLLSSYFYAQ